MAPEWFRPKRGGRGLRPAGAAGWIVTGVYLVLMVVAAAIGPAGIILVFPLTGLYLGLVALTGGRQSRRRRQAAVAPVTEAESPPEAGQYDEVADGEVAYDEAAYDEGGYEEPTEG